MNFVAPSNYFGLCFALVLALTGCSDSDNDNDNEDSLQ